GRDQPVHPQPCWHEPDQHGEDRPVGPVEPGPATSAAQHGDLVPQREQLGILGGRWSRSGSPGRSGPRRSVPHPQPASRMRWSLISLIAAAVLAIALPRTRSARSSSAADLIPLTRPELLALLRAVVLRAPRRDLAYTLHWSRWRRRHQ